MTRIARPALSTVLNGHASLSPDMALRVEKVFGPKMDTLLRMQTAYEIAEARGRAGEIIAILELAEFSQDSCGRVGRAGLDVLEGSGREFSGVLCHGCRASSP